jgi:serine/threonine protein kinase
MSFNGQEFGRYRLCHLLGGSIGEVYFAKDTYTDRDVAVKVFRLEILSQLNGITEQEALRLFTLKVEALTSLNHTPHIAPLLNRGRERIAGTDVVYLVRPYYPEGSLADWLRQYSNVIMPPQDVASLVQKVAEALQYTHDQRILHRRLKPSNILVSGGVQIPNPQIVDFEVTLADTHVADVSWVNPAYIAPEQWRGMPCRASDQYALAVITHQLLTNTLPFQGTPEQIKTQHLHMQAKSPDTYNSDLPSSINGIILHALKKRPEERFSSIAQFADVFREAAQTGKDLRITLLLSQTEARFGSTRIIKLPSGESIEMSIPAGSQQGQELYLEGKGELPRYGGRRGDLLITLEITHQVDRIPREITNPDEKPTSTTAADHESTALIHISRPEQQGASPSIAQAGLPSIPATSMPAPSPSQSNQAVGGVIAKLGAYILRNFSNSLRPPRARPSMFIALAVLVIVASIGLFSTVGVNVLVNGGVQATATAQIKAVSTSYASLARATAQAALDPYPPKNGTLVLDDPLHDNQKGYGWNEAPGCELINGVYQVSGAAQSYNYCHATQELTFQNFTYQVQMTLTQGDFAGIVFRADTTKNTFYYFGINAKGQYALFYYNSSYFISILDLSSSSAIHSGLGQSNTIAVVAQGSNLDFYVNMQRVAGIKDALYTRGSIGVAAGIQGGATEATFSNAKVWNI